MKEFAEFSGKDIRAVENPYEATFELADMADAFSRSTVVWLWVLVFFFIFYMALTVVVIYLDIYVFNQSAFRYLAVVMGFINLGVGALSIRWISSSMRSFRSISRNHSLLRKIDETTAEKHPFSGESDPSKTPRPQNALNSLIETTISDSRQLLSTFRFVYVFIALWMVNASVYDIIQGVRFGPDPLNWTVDWIVPGGFGLDAIIFLVVSIIAYLKSRDRFVFLKIRYQAIEYALNRPRAIVPAGADPFERYKAFLASQDEYRDSSGWKNDAYFDGMFQTPSGKMLVKSLDAPPDAEILAEFIMHVRAQGPNVCHPVILYPEDPERPLPESVYNDVVDNPVRLGKEICTVELVMEGQDGFYDLIPVVSP